MLSRSINRQKKDRIHWMKYLELWINHQLQQVNIKLLDVLIALIMKYANNFKPKTNTFYYPTESILIYVSLYDNKRDITPYVVYPFKSIKQVIIQILKANNIDIELYKQYQLWQWKKITYDEPREQEEIDSYYDTAGCAWGSGIHHSVTKWTAGFEGFAPIRKDRLVRKAINIEGMYWLSINKPHRWNSSMVYAIDSGCDGCSRDCDHSPSEYPQHHQYAYVKAEHPEHSAYWPK
eukprot:509887_1